MLSSEEILLELKIAVILIPFSCALNNKCQVAFFFFNFTINCFFESAAINHMQISCLVGEMWEWTLGGWLWWIELESSN